MSIDMTLQKWAIFKMCVYGKISNFFVGSSWNFVSDCLKNVDTHHESFSSKKQLIKKSSSIGKELSMCLTLINQTHFVDIFYYLIFRAETYMICVNIFMYSETWYKLDSTKNDIFPHRPPFKKSHKFNVMTLPKMSDFYNGVICLFLFDPTEIFFSEFIKRWRISSTF